MDSPSLLAIVLLIVALGLFFAEVFIPSGGLILIVGLVSLAGAIWSAHRAWWTTSPTTWWVYLGGVVVLLPIAVCTMLYIFPRTSIGKRVLLDAPSLDEVTGYNEEREHLATLIGKTGSTMTLLNPGGMVVVNGERYHCESEGLMVESQVRVDVVGVKGNRLVVRIVDEHAASTLDPQEPADATEPDPFLS